MYSARRERAALPHRCRAEVAAASARGSITSRARSRSTSASWAPPRPTSRRSSRPCAWPRPGRARSRPPARDPRGRRDARRARRRRRPRRAVQAPRRALEVERVDAASKARAGAPARGRPRPYRLGTRARPAGPPCCLRVNASSSRPGARHAQRPVGRTGRAGRAAARRPARLEKHRVSARLLAARAWPELERGRSSSSPCRSAPPSSTCLTYPSIPTLAWRPPWVERMVLISGHGGNAAALGRAERRLRAEGRAVLTWIPPSRTATHAAVSRPRSCSPSRPGDSVRAPGSRQPDAPLRAHGDRREGTVRGDSPNGVLGDPRSASAAQGRALLECMGAGLSESVARWLR